MSVTISVSVGYQRKRPSTTDRVEQRMDAAALFIAGAAVVLVLLIWILPKLLEWIASLI
jgi:hypothetical protein